MRGSRDRVDGLFATDKVSQLALRLVINLSAFLDELYGLLLHTGLQGFVIFKALLGSIITHILCDLHAAKMRSAH